MSLSLQQIVEELDNLSVEELLDIQERITELLRRKTTSNDIPSSKSKNANNIRAIVLTTPTQEEIEVELREFLGNDYAEVMAEIAANEGKLITLPPMPKSVSEYINEDREDRI